MKLELDLPAPYLSLIDGAAGYENKSRAVYVREAIDCFLSSHLEQLNIRDNPTAPKPSKAKKGVAA